MAVIYRKTATGEAADLISQSITQGIAQGRTDLVALQQQRNILESQSNLLTTQTQQSLGQIQENIYRTQRAKRAESAALGLVGAVSELRDISQVQDEVAATLSNVVNQAEQGAINIAGQQSALTQAEAQSAQSIILDKLADKLIEQGDSSISRDTAREVTAGITGAITGALKGAFGTVGAVKAGQTLINPTAGFFKKLAAGAGLGIGANMILGDFNTLASRFTPDEQGFLPSDWSVYGPGSLIGGGVALGSISRLAQGFVPKGEREAFEAALAAGEDSYKITKNVAGKEVSITRNISKAQKAAYEAAQGGSKWYSPAYKKGTELFDSKNLYDKATLKEMKKLKLGRSKEIAQFGQSHIGGMWKHRLNAISSKIRVNPFLIAAGATIGGLVGGLTAGLDKKYKIDVGALRQTSDTAQQLEALGVNLDALTNIVYNK